jgi:sec-independent protein translocase protein TatA
MGFGGISMGSLLLIFLIVLVLFGTKKLRTIGEDLGQAVRSFRKGLQDPNDKAQNDSNKSLP